MSKSYTVNKIDTSRIGLNSKKPQVTKIQVTNDILCDQKIKKNKLTDTQYQKKLDKKAEKENAKLKEIEVAQNKLLAEENEAKKVAQKAYDEEYTIAWIEENTEQLAINRSKKIYDRVYQETLDKIRKTLDKNTEINNKNTEINDKNTEINNKNTEIIDKNTEINDKNTEIQLLDESDDDDILPINNEKPVFKILNEKIFDENDTKDFKLVSYKKTNKKSQSKFIELLEKSKKDFSNEILNEETLNNIDQNFSKKNNKYVVTINIDNDILENTQGYNITKSGFLKNTNFMFSKYLGKIIYKRLNIPNVYVIIKKNDNTNYQIKFVEKQ
jgi:hypothetical protein